MSQQSTQQAWTYQFCPSESPDHARKAEQVQTVPPIVDAPGARRLPRRKVHPHSSSSVLLFATGIAASLLALGLLYISANALTAKVEYQRQRLQQDVAVLRARNVTLRCDVSKATDMTRVDHLAAAAGMHAVDPAAERDFLAVAPSNSREAARRVGWFSRGSMLIAALGRQMNAPYSVGRAEASELVTPQESKSEK